MAYTNSPLVAYTKLSPNHSGQRTHSIDRITPHCVVGQATAERICDCFISPDRQASCNYGIGTDGRVSLCVEDKNRSWCSSSKENDQRAITIECASDTSAPYAMNSKVYESLIKLCTDICQRNGKKKLLWFADKTKTLNYAPQADEMVLTVHRWFANKSCPGDWLYSRLGDLASRVTAALGSVPTETAPAQEHAKTELYRVRKTWADSKSQKGAYKILTNAKKCADANPGYSVFDKDGNAVYTGKQSAPVGEGGTDTSGCPFMVQVSISDLNIRKGPGTGYGSSGYTGKGCFTIVEEADGPGASKWGLLKSYADKRNGWISLDYAKKI